MSPLNLWCDDAALIVYGYAPGTTERRAFDCGRMYQAQRNAAPEDWQRGPVEPSHGWADEDCERSEGGAA